MTQQAQAQGPINFFARLLGLGKKDPKNLTISYLKGTRRQFTVEDGFVPVDDRDIEVLKGLKANGEPVERGGTGGDAFQVVTAEEAEKILKDEYNRSLLKGSSSGPGAGLALQNTLRMQQQQKAQRRLLEEQGVATPAPATPASAPANEAAPGATAGPKRLGQQRRKGG